MELLLIVGLIIKLIYDGIMRIVAEAKAERSSQIHKEIRRIIDEKNSKDDTQA